MSHPCSLQIQYGWIASLGAQANYCFQISNGIYSTFSSCRECNLLEQVIATPWKQSKAMGSLQRKRRVCKDVTLLIWRCHIVSFAVGTYTRVAKDVRWHCTKQTLQHINYMNREQYLPSFMCYLDSNIHTFSPALVFCRGHGFSWTRWTNTNPLVENYQTNKTR